MLQGKHCLNCSLFFRDKRDTRRCTHAHTHARTPFPALNQVRPSALFTRQIFSVHSYLSCLQSQMRAFSKHWGEHERLKQLSGSNLYALSEKERESIRVCEREIWEKKSWNLEEEFFVPDLRTRALIIVFFICLFSLRLDFDWCGEEGSHFWLVCWYWRIMGNKEENHWDHKSPHESQIDTLETSMHGAPAANKAKGKEKVLWQLCKQEKSNFRTSHASFHQALCANAKKTGWKIKGESLHCKNFCLWELGSRSSSQRKFLCLTHLVSLSLSPPSSFLILRLFEPRQTLCSPREVCSLFSSFLSQDLTLQWNLELSRKQKKVRTRKKEKGLISGKPEL